AAVHTARPGVHPRRGRVRWRPGPVGTEERATRPRPRPRGHVPGPARPGPALPAVRRSQPAALRSRVRQARRLPAADPPRPLHVRLHRTGPAPRAVWLGPEPVPAHGGALLEA